MGAWFMWVQVLTCLLGCAGFIQQGYVTGQVNFYWAAWTWFCYSAANIGFVGQAGGFK